jgi:hypothetical protein
MAACGGGGAVLLAAACAMTAAGVAGGSGGRAKKAADSWRAAELGAALGDTYTLQNTNCCCLSLSSHDEYSSMSQSVRTPRFLYRNFLSSPMWTSFSLISAVVCAAQELGQLAARTALFLQGAKKKRSSVLGMGRNRRASSAGSHA